MKWIVCEGMMAGFMGAVAVSSYLHGSYAMAAAFAFVSGMATALGMAMIYEGRQ